MSNRSFTQFTQETLSKTEKAWEGDLKKFPDLFPGDIARILAFAKQDFSHSDKNDLAYGVFEDGSSVADSIVQIVITKEGKKFVKMIDCFVRPSIYVRATKFEEGYVDKVVDVYIASIIGTLQIGDHHKANAIKVYGRSSALLAVLTIVAKLLKDQEDAHNAVAAIEGRWLVVKPKPAKKGK
jgi:hypothetical protein